MTSPSASSTSNRIYPTLTSINSLTHSNTPEDKPITSTTPLLHLHGQQETSNLPQARGNDLQSRYPSLSGFPINPPDTAEATNTLPSTQTPENQQIPQQIKQKIVDNISVIYKKGDMFTPKLVGLVTGMVLFGASILTMYTLIIASVAFPALIIPLCIIVAPFLFGSTAGLCAYPRYNTLTKTVKELEDNLKSLQSNPSILSVQQINVLNKILDNIEIKEYNMFDLRNHLYPKEKREELNRLLSELLNN